MRNVWVICRKELRSYFASPIAYAVMALFALIFGFVFYMATRDFYNFAFRSQMMGGLQPMNVNEQVIRPVLGFAGTVALFLIPMITMRLIAEEKRSGTIELLLTSPIQDFSIILGKRHLAVCVGQTRLEAGPGGLPRPDLARRVPSGHRHIHFRVD